MWCRQQETDGRHEARKSSTVSGCRPVMYNTSLLREPQDVLLEKICSQFLAGRFETLQGRNVFQYSFDKA